MMWIRQALPVLGLMFVLSGLLAELPAQQLSEEERAVVDVVDAYHAALAAGDSTAALALVTDDLIVLESGGRETLEEYRSGHLRGDMRFAQAVTRTRGQTDTTIVGDVAWVSSMNRMSGQMGEREIDSQSAELAVLTRSEEGWQIRAFHWSSRSR